MSELRSLNDIKKIDLQKLVESLKSEEHGASMNAGLKLAKEAASFGLNVRDYLLLAVGSEDGANGLNGYERTLHALNLPVKNAYADGIHLQAASDTFQTYTGTRAMFPMVIDDIVRFATRQDTFEKVEPMLANSRTINGVELLSTVIEDDKDARDSFQIPELANIPVRTIRTSEQSVKIWKHGSALRTSYEFSRRASLDLLVPHANRIARELELSKVQAATSVIINGDGAHGAAPVVTQGQFDAETGETSVANKINWVNFTYWLVQRARAGTPVNTVVMNWDTWFQWLMLFAQEKTAASSSFGTYASENLARAGVNPQMMPATINLMLNITPVISSSAPSNSLVGYTREDTLEELIEAGSNIAETERVITNQSIVMTKTENTGYRLVYGDTRQVYNFGA